MARSRMVVPDVTVLKISDGDTLTVKRRLNAGEQRAMFARRYKVDDQGRLVVDPLRLPIATILAYLVDWSITDPAGKLIPIADQPAEVVAAALDSLDPESVAEIRTAIEAHEAAMIEERTAQKKTSPGNPPSIETSPSPVVAIGATSGLLN